MKVLSKDTMFSRLVHLHTSYDESSGIMAYTIEGSRQMLKLARSSQSGDDLLNKFSDVLGSRRNYFTQGSFPVAINSWMDRSIGHSRLAPTFLDRR
uniref:Uncharacterized protein n=1 Tax=Steinernema glaseri TaxID=37863 RepID=A0A1I7YBB8_9BILA